MGESVKIRTWEEAGVWHWEKPAGKNSPRFRYSGFGSREEALRDAKSFFRNYARRERDRESTTEYHELEID